MFDVKLLQNYRPTASKIKPQEVVRSTYEWDWSFVRCTVYSVLTMQKITLKPSLHGTFKPKLNPGSTQL